MADDDWDLSAVVKSCNAVVATTTSTPTTTATTRTTRTSTVHNSSKTTEKDDDSLPSLDSLTFQNDDNYPFFIPGILDDENDSSQGLEEIYREICANPASITTATTITAAAGNPVTRVFQQAQPNQQKQQQQQQVIQRGQDFDFKNAPFDPSSITLTVASSQPIRPRKRKNQQSKMVRQMTQEELSADSWAWRKYGQKPIKGSPYPRNYYRCSTSKGCAARKQVERSPTEPNIYIVSYTGEHTHPRPTHRSSLAGSTRAKFSPPTNTSSGNPTTNKVTIIAPNNKQPPCTSSSPASGSSFSPSPNTPLVERDNVQEDDIDMLKAENHDDDDVDDEGILIPDEFMSEDIFKGFQEMDGINRADNNTSGTAAGDNHNLLSPPWTNSSSTFMGGGG